MQLPRNWSVQPASLCSTCVSQCWFLLSRPAPPWPVLYCQWSCKSHWTCELRWKTMLRTTTSQHWFLNVGLPAREQYTWAKNKITLLQRDFRLSHQFVICCQARSRLWFFFKSSFCLLPILKFRGHFSKTKKCKSTLLQRTSFLNQQVCIPKSSVIAIAFTSKFSNRQQELDLLKW